MEDGVDLNKVTTNGYTALHIAAQRGHAKIRWAYGASLTARSTEGRLPIDLAANEAIGVLIHDESRRRTDHGHKRAVIPDPDIEQTTKRSHLEGEGEGQSSVSVSASSAAAAPLTAEELKYEEEVNGDSASSDEEKIDGKKIHYRHILSDNKNV